MLRYFKKLEQLFFVNFTKIASKPFLTFTGFSAQNPLQITKIKLNFYQFLIFFEPKLSFKNENKLKYTVLVVKRRFCVLKAVKVRSGLEVIFENFRKIIARIFEMSENLHRSKSKT